MEPGFSVRLSVIPLEFNKQKNDGSPQNESEVANLSI